MKSRRHRYAQPNQNPRGVSMQPQPALPPVQQVQLPPLIGVADFVFMLHSLIGIDVHEYNAGAPGRCVTMYLAGPTTHEFLDERADKAWRWYLAFTGQGKVAPA